MGILEKLKSLFRKKPAEEVRPEEKPAPEEIKPEEEAIEERVKLEEKPAEIMEELEKVASPEEEIRPKLYPTDPVIKAPEIGFKTAELLRKADIDTIEELLKTPIREIQRRLAQLGKRVYRATIYRWKVETKLMMEIPTLRIRDVKYLYELKIRSRSELLKYTPEELYNKLQSFLNTKEGQTLAKHYDPPTLEEIKRWIEDAKRAAEKIPEVEVVF